VSPFQYTSRFLPLETTAAEDRLLEEHSEMNSVDTFEKRLREAIAAVEKEIQSHSQEVEALTKRLEGLKRADELFESDQPAIAELLQANIGNGSGITRGTATAPAPTTLRTANLKTTGTLQKQLGRTTRTGRGNMKTGRAQSVARSASQPGGLTRVDMIAAVLRRHPRRTVRELIALLDKEFRWKTNESAVTGKLYTRREKFVHTQPDRSTNRPVTWSLK
jgi:hypothetical protein